MTADELRQLGEELGLDVVGAAPAAPYEETERHIHERRERGLFGTMRFTMAQPEVSCHPETLLEGARTVVSAALCYYVPGPEAAPGQGRLPRHHRLRDLLRVLQLLPGGGGPPPRGPLLPPRRRAAVRPPCEVLLRLTPVDGNASENDRHSPIMGRHELPLRCQTGCPAVNGLQRLAGDSSPALTYSADQCRGGRP